MPPAEPDVPAAAPAPRTRYDLERRLRDAAGRPVRLALHRNRSVLASVRTEADGTPVVRLHEAFLGAPEPVLDALGRHLATGRRAWWRVVARYAASVGVARPGPAGTAVAARRAAAGRVHDLEAIRLDVNARFFANRLRSAIEWGSYRPPGRRGRRSIRYGTYLRERDLVRVHPALDRPDVPREFVAYIVFHELLHADVPSVHSGERRRDHPAEFRLRERHYPDRLRMRRLARDLVGVLSRPPPR